MPMTLNQLLRATVVTLPLFQAGCLDSSESPRPRVDSYRVDADWEGLGYRIIEIKWRGKLHAFLKLDHGASGVALAKIGEYDIPVEKNPPSP